MNSQFLLDGDPFTYIAGEIHYFRIPHQKWDDRLKRVRALGFNAITVPVPWNLHQFYQDETPILSGNLDLVKFIKAAESNGLYTILRIGNSKICIMGETLNITVGFYILIMHVFLQIF